MTTKLTRWDPFEELANLWPRSLFGRDLRTSVRPGGELALEWSPRCDITTGDDAISIEVELPGVPAEDIDLSLDGTTLVIKGEKREEKKEEKEGRTYSERFFGTFERRIPVPEGVDASAIEARATNGVLYLKVPTPPAKTVETKKIEIKSN